VPHKDLEAQSASGATSAEQHQVVLDLPDVDAATLFDKAQIWANTNYNTEEEFVQLADPQQNRIKCKGFFVSKVFMFTIRVKHSLYLDFKDGKCRYTFTDFVYQSASGGNSLIERAALSLNKNRMLKITKKQAQKMGEDLEEYMGT
jgi:hypothetical protein